MLTGKKIINKYIWLILLFIGFLGFLSIWFLMPHKSEIDHIGQMIYKIVIFLIIVAGISLFPNRKKWYYLFLIMPVLGFTGYLIPRLSYLCYHAVAQNHPDGSQEYYTQLYLLTYPAVLLTLCFAYRIGGGTPGKCFKIGCAGMFILFSGFLDIMIYLITPLEIPEKLIYAHHIATVIGKYPTYLETILFTTFHLPFIICLFIIPIDKWIHKWLYNII